MNKSYIIKSHITNIKQRCDVIALSYIEALEEQLQAEQQAHNSLRDKLKEIIKQPGEQGQDMLTTINKMVNIACEAIKEGKLMNEERLAEIEKMAESMEVSARDENIILDLIQALRDERTKTSDLHFESERRHDEVIRLCNMLKDERLKVEELEAENKRLNARNNMQQEENNIIIKRMRLYAQELDELKPLEGVE